MPGKMRHFFVFSSRSSFLEIPSKRQMCIVQRYELYVQSTTERSWLKSLQTLWFFGNVANERRQTFEHYFENDGKKSKQIEPIEFWSKHKNRTGAHQFDQFFSFFFFFFCSFSFHLAVPCPTKDFQLSHCTFAHSNNNERAEMGAYNAIHHRREYEKGGKKETKKEQKSNKKLRQNNINNSTTASHSVLGLSKVSFARSLALFVHFQ